MADRGTIAIVYASIGSGHRIAAEALAQEFASGAEGFSAELIDVLDYAFPRLSGNLLTASFTGVTAGLYDAAWANPGFVSGLRTVSTPLLSLMSRGFSRRLAELQPAAIVCTHALGAALAAYLRRRGEIRAHVVNVVSDYGVHGFWPRDQVSLFCVASDEGAQELYARGYRRETVAVTGIPVRPQFTLDYDRSAARQHFNLPPERRLILALAGSMQPGPYERFKEGLAVALPALASLPNTALAVVTGGDEMFAEELRSRAKGFGATNVSVFGFVDRMAPLMAAADLGLAKPGGSVCAECLAAALPLVLVGPASGQERANVKALTDGGAALFASDPRTIAEYVRKALSRPLRLKSLQEAAEKIARPFAASDVVRHVIELADPGSGAQQP